MENTEQNTARLAREIRKGLRTIGATMVKQNYKGTGTRKAARQLWCRFDNGAVIDLWLGQGPVVQLGGVVRNGGQAPASNVQITPGDSIEAIAAAVTRNVKTWKDGV